MRLIALVAMFAVAASSLTADQNPLDAAKSLYASAAYEEALTTLSRLNDSASSAPAELRQVDEYRAFCLYALGRTAEAESVAESLIRREPLAKLDAADASPRLEAMFAGVQKRVLPGLIRDEYRNVRSLIDQKQFAAAEPRLVDMKRMLNEVQRLGALDDGLADLTVLVDGFLSLSRAHAEVRAAPPAAAAPPPAKVVEAPPSGPAESPADVSNVRTEPRVYTVEDSTVTPPVAIYQREPSIPVELMTILRTLRKPTILGLTIDETGSVAKADVRVSVNRRYDALLLWAANNWKYRPAMKDNTPVKYEKLVVVEVK